MDTDNEKLQKNTNELRSIAEKVGLRFNNAKCESMATLNNDSHIFIDNSQVKVTNTFTYLGSKISNTGISNDEIKVRIGKAGTAFGKLKSIFNTKHISTKTKINLYNALVLSILLYGSETWTIYATEANKLDAFHQRCLRKFLEEQVTKRSVN